MVMVSRGCSGGTAVPELVVLEVLASVSVNVASEALGTSRDRLGLESSMPCGEEENKKKRVHRPES